MSQQAAQRDTLDSFLAGPPSVKERDAPMPQFARTKPAPGPEGSYVLWSSGTQCGPTKAYVTGSFQSLVEAGKISREGEQSVQMDPRKTMMPGYTGYIRGAQHISARTYGESTRLASSAPYREHVTTSPIPCCPQNNRKIEQQDLKDRFMYGIHQGKLSHLPGTTLHVPNLRGKYGVTYGRATREEMELHQQRYNRRHPQEQQGYAHPTRVRDYHHIESRSLPGPLPTTVRPHKCVPSYMKHMQYFAR
jgi:hypothetical protein